MTPQPTFTYTTSVRRIQTQANLGEVRVDYSPKSYVGIRRGRRVWAPLWFRRDGALIYLPDPDGLRGEVQSPAMDEFQERLRREGLETSWQPTYNAGANPVPIRLRQADLAKPVVQELLRATFEILDPSATPWSERHPQPPATTPATTPASVGTSMSRTGSGDMAVLPDGPVSTEGERIAVPAPSGAG